MQHNKLKYISQILLIITPVIEISCRHDFDSLLVYKKKPHKTSDKIKNLVKLPIKWNFTRS